MPLQEQSSLDRSEMVTPNSRAPVVTSPRPKWVLKAGSIETAPKLMLFVGRHLPGMLNSRVGIRRRLGYR